MRYIDDLVVRDRDTTGSGTLNERLYALQDPNWNMLAMVNSSGVVQERYCYDAYGSTTFLTPAFAIRTASTYAWETLYAGYRRDSEISAYQVRSRVLDPLLGWLQRDPLGISGGTNLYEYVGSNSIVRADPTGELHPAALVALILATICGGAGLGAVIGQLYNDMQAGGPGFNFNPTLCSFVSGCVFVTCLSILGVLIGVGVMPPWVAIVGLGIFLMFGVNISQIIASFCVSLTKDVCAVCTIPAANDCQICNAL